MTVHDQRRLARVTAVAVCALVCGLLFAAYETRERAKVGRANCQALKAFVDASVEREVRFGTNPEATRFWESETERLKSELLPC